VLPAIQEDTAGEFVFFPINIFFPVFSRMLLSKRPCTQTFCGSGKKAAQNLQTPGEMTTQSPSTCKSVNSS